MKQLTATDYEAEEGFMIVRKSNGRVYGYSIQLGPADTIDEFEEKAFTEEERAAFWESIGMEDTKKMNSQDRSSIATISYSATSVTDELTTTSGMSVDSTGMKVSATSVTDEVTTTSSMSVDSTGMKVSIVDGETTKDVVSVDSTGLTVQSPKIVLKNELGTPRIWTDSDAIYIETDPPVTIKSDMDDVNITSVSGSVYIDAGGTVIDAGLNAIRLSAANSIGIYAGTVDSVGNSLTMDFPEITITGNIDLPNYDNKVTIASQIDYGGEVETLGDAELLPIKKFGRTRYLAPIDTLYSQGSSVEFSPEYLYSTNLLTLPNGTIFSDYYLFNPGDTTIDSFSFRVGTSDGTQNTLPDTVFLIDKSSNVINLSIPSWCIAIVRICISNTGLNIPVGDASKHAYIVRGEHLGTFSTY